MFFTTRKATTTVLLVAALIAALTTPSFADKKHDLEKQKKGVSGKIGDAKKDLELSSKKYANAVAALKTAQGKLDAAKSQLSNTRGALATAKAQDAEMQAKLAATEAELDAAMARLSKGKAELRSSEAKVEQFAVQNIEQGDPGMRAFSDLLRGEDPNEFSEQMSLNDAVSDAQLATMQNLAATRVILEVNRDRVAEAARPGQGPARSRRGQPGPQAAARGGRRDAGGRGRRARHGPQGRARHRREAPCGGQEAAGFAGVRAQTAREPDPGAHAQAGQGRRRRRRRHAVPSGQHGPITSPYGMRFHPMLHVWKLHDGTDFGVPCGTPVHAAAAGTVMQTYYNGGYGNRVILNNGRMRGESVVTTYNHLTRWIVRPGTARQPRPDHRLLRHDRLLHRLPPALHGPRQRRDREPDGLAVNGLSPGHISRETMVTWPRKPGASSLRRTRRRATTITSKTPLRPDWSSPAPR